MDDIYDKIVIKGDKAHFESDEYYVKKGKHSLWIPELEMKIPWSLNGKITSFRDWKKGKDVESITNYTFGNIKWEVESLQSIMNEYTIFKEFEKVKFSPPMNGIFHIKTCISDFYGKEMYEDRIGLYGYYMEDANKLPKGKYTFEKFVKKFFDRMTFSEWTQKRTDRGKGIFGGALGDLRKIENTINGYLIDVRRSMFDMLKWKDLNTESYKELII